MSTTDPQQLVHEWIPNPNSRGRGCGDCRMQPKHPHHTGVKTCTLCKTSKPVTEFNLLQRRNRRPAIRPECKPCFSSVTNQAKYRAKSRAKTAAQRRAAREADLEIKKSVRGVTKLPLPTREELADWHRRGCPLREVA